MRLALAVVLICCSADDSLRRRWRTQQRIGRERYARQQEKLLREKPWLFTPRPTPGPTQRPTLAPTPRPTPGRPTSAPVRRSTPVPAPPTPSRQPAAVPVEAGCPATRRGCAFDHDSGFGAGAWQSTTPDPREDAWMSDIVDNQTRITRHALGAWRWRSTCTICAMTPPAEVGRAAQICARFAAANVRSLLIVGDSTSHSFYGALQRQTRAAEDPTFREYYTLKKIKFVLSTACNDSLRLAFLRDDRLWGDDSTVTNATCQTLAAQGLAVAEKCGDRSSAFCRGRGPKTLCRNRLVARAHWATALLPKWDVVVANTGAHHNSKSLKQALTIVADKLENGTGDATFLFRGLYRPMYGCTTTFLQGPSPPDRIEALEAALALKENTTIAFRDTYRWHQFLDFERSVEDRLLAEVRGAALFDIGPLATARTDLHAKDCLHFSSLPGSRAGIYKWWIPMLLDYCTEMRRPGAPPGSVPGALYASHGSKSPDLPGFMAWRAALFQKVTAVDLDAAAAAAARIRVDLDFKFPSKYCHAHPRSCDRRRGMLTAERMQPPPKNNDNGVSN